MATTSPRAATAPPIARLDALVADLGGPDRVLFDRIFRYSVAEGAIVPPPELEPSIVDSFGSLEAVRCQRIVKTLNRLTGEGALFNPLRSRRPTNGEGTIDVAAEIERARGDAFCDPDRHTPADLFGRAPGRACQSAANLAKYDGLHGVVVFDRHDPLEFGADQVADYLRTAERWIELAHRHDPLAHYPIITWNCLWKAGGSIVHGHAQVALGRDFHYARVEALRQAAERYAARYQVGYFADLAQISRALGLGLRQSKLVIAASLTPIKEKEIVIWGPSLDDAFRHAIYRALSCLRDRLGVRSFNLALALPPLGPTPEDWTGVPVVARLVDRGNPAGRSADIGAMELYGSSVVSGDPFTVAAHLREAFAGAATVDR